MRYALLLLMVLFARPAAADCVILLHGLARSEASLVVMEAALEAEGFQVLADGSLRDLVLKFDPVSVEQKGRNMVIILFEFWMLK